jgi:hypothetical protein
MPTEPTPSAPDRQLRIFAIAISLEFPRVRFSVAELTLAYLPSKDDCDRLDRPSPLGASRLILGLEFTPSPPMPAGAVLLLAQSPARADQNHSGIDLIHIQEISFRTSRLHMRRKTLARDRRY